MQLPEIPSGWQHSTVDAEFDIGTGFTLGEHRHPRLNTHRYLRVANVQRNAVILDDLAELEASEEELIRRCLAKNDIVLVEGHADPREIGRCALVPPEAAGLTFQNHLFRLRARRLDPRFAIMWLNSEWSRSYWRTRCATTSGLHTINQRLLRALPVIVPPPDEQSGVAGIIEGVDAIIQRTRTSIEKTRRLKRGLMQRVFSAGIGHRSFKQSELGGVPSPWDIVRGKQAFRTLGGYAPSQIRFARPAQPADAWFMKVDDFNAPANQRQITTTSRGFLTAENPQIETLPIGTVVIAKRGAAIEKNRVRTTAVPVALDPNLMGLRLVVGIDPEFFRFQLEWRRLSRYIESSGVPQLNNKDLYPRLFLQPSEEEQKQIVRLLSATEESEDRTADILAKIERLKRGLTQDLLSGRVRVGSLEVCQARPLFEPTQAASTDS